jgi:hypothetical protein
MSTALLQHINTSTSFISAKSASAIVITMAVYNFMRNECIYYGDEQSCRELEFTNDSLIAIPL